MKKIFLALSVLFSLVLFSCATPDSGTGACVKLNLPSFNNVAAEDVTGDVAGSGPNVSGSVVFYEIDEGTVSRDCMRFPITRKKIVVNVPGERYYNVEINLNVGSDSYFGTEGPVYISSTDVNHLSLHVKKISGEPDLPDVPENPEGPGDNPDDDDDDDDDVVIPEGYVPSAEDGEFIVNLSPLLQSGQITTYVLNRDAYLKYSVSVSSDVTICNMGKSVVIGFSDYNKNNSQNTNQTMFSTSSFSLELKGASKNSPLIIDPSLCNNSDETALETSSKEKKNLVINVQNECSIGPNVEIRNNVSQVNTFENNGAILVKGSAAKLNVCGLTMTGNVNKAQYNGVEYDSGDINLYEGTVILDGYYQGSIFLYRQSSDTTKQQKIIIGKNFDSKSSVKIISNLDFTTGKQYLTPEEDKILYSGCFEVTDWNGHHYSVEEDGSFANND